MGVGTAVNISARCTTFTSCVLLAGQCVPTALSVTSDLNRAWWGRGGRGGQRRAGAGQAIFSFSLFLFFSYDELSQGNLFGKKRKFKK